MNDLKEQVTKREMPPFRYDVVGSFLRPSVLKNARKDFKENKISGDELAAVENQAITELVAKEKSAGLHSITDGEFRRSWWHLDFMWGLNGIQKRLLNQGYVFHGETTRGETVHLSETISGENHPFVQHFKFLKDVAGEGVVARQTIPAPAQLLAELYRSENKESTSKIYPNLDRLLDDIAKAYRHVIADLYQAGCRNIQFDDCTWGMFCDKKYWEARQNGDLDLRDLANLYLQINNLALEGHPDDLVINTHVCRGNYHSTWAASGGYAPIADILFGNENVSAYYLEFDSDRCGDFSPLKEVSGNKLVVLGLISSKTPQLEKKEEIIARIHEAESYLPLNRLCLSPQCGFASTEEGNILTEEDQWAKIALAKEIAEEVW